VDPQLLELDDPYDPALNRKVPILWDASLYKGRYYLYFGAVPALLFHLPIRLVAGVYPDDHLVICVLSLLVIFVLVLIFRLLLAQNKCRTHIPLWLWSVVIASSSNLSLQLGGGIYVISTISGQLFVLLALFFLLRSLESKNRAALFFASGISFALAVGSRPTTLPYVIIFTLFGASLLFRKRLSLRLFASFLSPLILGAAVLTTFNYARFNDPFEFGLSYQITLADLRSAGLCSFSPETYPHRFILQTWYSMLSPPDFSLSFPHVFFPKKPATWIDVPDEMIGIDAVSGILWTSPVTLLGLYFYFRNQKRLRPDVLWLLISACVASVLTYIVLGGCRYSASRYALDYLGVWIVCATLGICLELEREGSKFYRCVRNLLLVFTIAWTVAVGTLGLWEGYYGKYKYIRYHQQVKRGA
jgi:hypothetical protein